MSVEHIKAGSVAYALTWLMVDETDHITGKTGLTPTVVISKNAGAYAAPAGVVSEVGNGTYKLVPTSADTASLGPLNLHATAVGADPKDEKFQIVAYDPQDESRLGLLSIPVPAAGASGGLPLGDASGQVTLTPATITSIWTNVQAEAFAVFNAVPSPIQVLHWANAHFRNRATEGTTETLKKANKTDTAGTNTLNSATNPTSREATS